MNGAYAVSSNQVGALAESIANGGGSPSTEPSPAGPVVRWSLRRFGLSDYLAVVDRRTVKALERQGAAAVVISFLEVAALAAVGPLVQLLSGSPLTATGITGKWVEALTSGLSDNVRTLALLGFVVSLLVLRAALSAALRWWTIGTVTVGSSRATAGLLAAYVEAPLSFHAQRNSAQATRTAALSIITVYAAGLLGLASVMSEAAVVLLVGVMLMFVTPLGAFSAILYFGAAMALYSRILQRRTSGTARHRDQLQAAWLALLQQVLGGLKEIRLRGVEAEYTNSFAHARASQNVSERRIMFAAEFGRYFLEITFLLGFGLLAAVVLLTQSDSSAAVLGVLLAAGFRLLPSASRLLNAFSRVREGQGSLSMLTDELHAMGRSRLPMTLPEGARAEVLGDRSRGPLSVEFRGVGFSYPSSRARAVRDLSGTVPAGKSLGIVGASGAGKTTVVDLLCGLLAPSEGEVLIGGVSTTRDREEWQRNIGYVPQEIFLLDGTLGENIAFTTGEVDGDRLARAVELAQLESWLSELPEGLETRVGERGALLSGGQRQRIGIARALYREPSVLILDEATSALDVETEAYVTSAINNLSGGVTLVVVAHRLSTVRHCDEILMLDGGAAAGWASFDELSNENGRFARWLGLAGMTPERSAEEATAE